MKKQEMPSRQQKPAKKCPERYSVIGPNPILVILMCDDGRSTDQENIRCFY